jgi:hypothetical protein
MFDMRFLNSSDVFIIKKLKIKFDFHYRSSSRKLSLLKERILSRCHISRTLSYHRKD